MRCDPQKQQQLQQRKAVAAQKLAELKRQVQQDQQVYAATEAQLDDRLSQLSAARSARS